MSSNAVKRRLDDEVKPRSSAQMSRARKVERTKDLEKRVVSLTRMRDALTIKNRMMKQFIDVKNATLARETHVTSYLRLRNAQLIEALEEIYTIKAVTISESEMLLRTSAMRRAISLLGPDFNFLDYLICVNAYVTIVRP